MTTKISLHTSSGEIREASSPAVTESASAAEAQLSWDEKMAELEAIHQEIAPQVTALREALDEETFLFFS